MQLLSTTTTQTCRNRLSTDSRAGRRGFRQAGALRSVPPAEPICEHTAMEPEQYLKVIHFINFFSEQGNS